MVDKLLCGVPHESDLGILVLINMLSPKNYTSVGLEVTSNYEADKASGCNGYFFTLGAELEALGKRIVPLDDSAMRDEAMVLGYLLQIMKRVPERSVINEIKALKRKWASQRPKEIPQTREYYDKFYYHDLSAWFKKYKDKQTISNRFRDLNTVRESVFLERIRAHTIDVVIVGEAHAAQLRPSLPDYSYRVISL